MGKNIFITEDDESIRELVLYTLRETGFEAEGFENPALFWAAASGCCCRAGSERRGLS